MDDLAIICTYRLQMDAGYGSRNLQFVCRQYMPTSEVGIEVYVCAAVTREEAAAEAGGHFGVPVDKILVETNIVGFDKYDWLFL